jgi:hypothetical protein
MVSASSDPQRSSAGLPYGIHSDFVTLLIANQERKMLPQRSHPGNLNLKNRSLLDTWVCTELV